MLTSLQIYKHLSSLSHHQMDELISRLQSRGISIRAIRPYAYPEMPQAFHIFFLFDGSNEELDYFQLEPEVLDAVCRELSFVSD